MHAIFCTTLTHTNPELGVTFSFPFVVHASHTFFSNFVPSFTLLHDSENVSNSAADKLLPNNCIFYSFGSKLTSTVPQFANHSRSLENNPRTKKKTDRFHIEKQPFTALLQDGQEKSSLYSLPYVRFYRK